MARFMLTTMPFTGHVAPLSAVAEALVARGHDVRFYTGAAFRERVESTGARLVPWRVAPDFDENDISATFPRLLGKKGIASAAHQRPGRVHQDLARASRGSDGGMGA